jgi:parallel beta-helix repeat protein
MQPRKTALAALPLALLAVMGSLVTTTHTASATTRELFVSPTGSDSNPGTRTQPFRQVNKAASVATAGTLVHVAAGTYGPVTSTRSGTSGAPIVFQSDSRWGATINGAGRTTAWTNTGQWVVINRFNIVGAAYNGILTSASYNRFGYNHVHDLRPPDCSRGGAGIVAENYSARGIDVIGNQVDHILVAGDCARIHGIYLQSPNAGRVVNNLVFETSGWGIHLWHNASYITIVNNTVFRNRQGGIVVGASLEGNDIAPGVAQGVVVTNNVAVANGRYGIREMGRVGRNTYANNLLYGNSSGAYSLMSGNVATGTVTSNPQFVRYDPYGRGDYRLRTVSPAIDRGTTLKAPSNDLQLVGRPKGRGPDIGAYEGGH